MEGGSLNPKDFVTFKSELDLLCDEDVDVFHRWNILENIQKTKVYNNVNLFLAAGGVEPVQLPITPPQSPPPDRLVYLEEEETTGTPFLKEPVGCIPPLGSLRVGSLSVLTELAKKDVYRRRIWSLDIVGPLCKRFTTRMSYVLKFSPSRYYTRHITLMGEVTYLSSQRPDSLFPIHWRVREIGLDSAGCYYNIMNGFEMIELRDENLLFCEMRIF
eukprot:sb/3469993/